ncbi:MAG: hypothetical protein IJN92_08685 [Lachnospiraceae bacterium]|nr:hypothetical protein [Lachnospiraceae bacterium]
MSLITNEAEVSLFHYEIGTSFVLQGEMVAKEEQEKVYRDMVRLYEQKKMGAHEMCLFRVLSTYGCLNKYMITKALNRLGYIPAGIRKTDYSNLLMRLRKENMIECYRMSKPKETDTRTLYVYTLSNASKRLLFEKEQRDSAVCDMEDAAGVLECLSLNQYAIAVKAEKKGKCYLPYNVEGKEKKMVFPFGMKSKNMTVLSYVCKKKEEQEELLIRDMVYLLNTIKDSEDMAVILIGEDMEHIGKVAAKLLSYESLLELPAYYAIEAAYDKNPFEWLYAPEVVDGNLRFYKVDITPFL